MEKKGKSTSSNQVDLAAIYTDTHVVQKGESLTKISLLYRVRKQELVFVNNLLGDNIYQGQVLKVPKTECDLAPVEKHNQISSYQIDNDIVDGEVQDDEINKEFEILSKEELKADEHRKDLVSQGVVLTNYKADPLTSIDRVKSQFQQIQANFTALKSEYTGPQIGDEVGTDPVALAMFKEEQFDPSAFLQRGDPNKPEQTTWLSTGALYQTRFEHIKGILTLKQDCLSFVATEPSKQSDVKAEVFNNQIDYLDIVSVNGLKIPNEEGADHHERYVRENYKFNYLIQIEVSAINGMTCREQTKKYLGKKQTSDSGAAIVDDEGGILSRSKISLANIFFKLQHEDFSESKHFLINKEQEKVQELIIAKLQEKIKNGPSSNSSMTYIPFYDSIVSMQQKQMIGNIKMDPKISEKVKKIQLRSLSKNSQQNSSAQQVEQTNQALIKYRPRKTHDSLILTDIQISKLCAKIPSMFRNLEWQLLYRLSENGVSMNTFLARLNKKEPTLILFEDSDGYKFGGMNYEAWVPQTQFYGNGENFLFTFKDGIEVTKYLSTGDNFMFQYSDRKCIGMGGGEGREARFALYLGDDFLRGSSSRTECFNNDQLSGKQDFMCVELEVWGFD